MKIDLPWGSNDTLSINVPDTWEIIFPDRIDVAPDERDEVTIVRDALDNPAAMQRIQDYDLTGKKVVIVTDDNTRPTPVYKFFHVILEAVSDAGASLDDVLVITALGIHTEMTEEDMAGKIGNENLSLINWENHKAFDNDANYHFGTTSRGTPVYLNKHLQDADFIILLGMVEPHIFAGFGGGMKCILPGVASADTIGIHHELIATPSDQFNRVGALPEDNPFRLDLEEVKEMIDAPIFCVNVLTDTNKTIEAAYAGDPIAEHREAIQYNTQAQGLHFSEQVDGIIVCSYPMDYNFKQSMKCIGNSLPALKPYGEVMGFLKAEHGLDDIPMPEPFPLPLWILKILLRLLGPSLVYPFVKLLKGDLNAEDKFQYYYTVQLIRAYNVSLYVPTITEEEAESLLFFNYCQSPDEVIQKAKWRLGPNARVAVFPEGGATFSVLGE